MSAISPRNNTTMEQNIDKFNVVKFNGKGDFVLWPMEVQDDLPIGIIGFGFLPIGGAINLYL